jgi:hypothetical protein
LTAVLATMSAFGQAAPAPAPAPAPAAAPPPWSVGPIDFSGLVDGYYTYNGNHPPPTPAGNFSSIASAGNQLYNFNVNANQFSLNMAKISLAHGADPVGFQVDLGFGKAFDIIHAFEPGTAPAFMRNVEQAFVTYKPSKDKAFQFDFGKFVTSAGAEVIESHSNWNYSRSLLFSWAIPYYHFGLRMTGTRGHFTGGFQLVNGWNNVDDNNTGKTIGLVGNLTSSKVSWMNNYYAGPEKAGINDGFRHLYDTTVLFTPTSKLNAYVNFDYGRENNLGKADPYEWYGIAGAAKVQATDKSAFAVRGEWFNDRDGFNTGAAQSLKEVTLTYEYKWMQGLLARLEYRGDWSGCPSGNDSTCKDVKFFNKNGNPGASGHQHTVSVGIVAFFGPH